MKIDERWLDTHEWMLRSSNGGESYEGFRWKRKGAWTRAKQWSPRPYCGNGLHGEAPEAHGFGFLYGTLELCETRGLRVAIGDDKIKVPEARIVARGREIPEAAFERCGYQVAHAGKAITPQPGERWLVLSGVVHIKDQQGGFCEAVDHATLNAEGQQGGFCEAVDHATLNAEGQQGGACQAYDLATLNAEGQQGGFCEAVDHATLNAEGQQGGFCEAVDYATLNAEGQQGGSCQAYGHATVNRSDGG